jgi:ATP-binding protein involved in chromosome partitioning
VKSISDSGDAGKPIVLEENNITADAFSEIAKRVAQQVAICNAEANNKNLVIN